MRRSPLRLLLVWTLSSSVLTLSGCGEELRGLPGPLRDGGATAGQGADASTGTGTGAGAPNGSGETPVVDAGAGGFDPPDGGQPALDAGTPGTGTDGGGFDAGTSPLDGGAPDAGTSTVSFFVTSRGNGMGGNLGGLAGADAFCKSLATAVSTAMGAKTWRAYLSTPEVNARDRIGAGPWRNVRGVVIASSVAELHEEGGLTNAISGAAALDENGAALANNVHDILTGSTVDGRVAGNGHCNGWTSNGAERAQVGHSNRMGGGSTSWNSVHLTGSCSAQGVTTGGGRGSLYCFALEGG